jgi:hypothetical protein
MSRLEISLYPGPVTEAPADTIIALVPSDERPLGGDAGRIDWRLCGRISEQLSSGYATGALGEAVLLPAGRPLNAARLLLVGLGERAQLPEGRPLLRAMRCAADKLVALRSSSGLLAWPRSVSFDADAVSLLRGLVHGLQGAPEDAVLHIVLPAAEECEKALLAALSEVVPGAHSWGIAIDVNWIEV